MENTKKAKNDRYKQIKKEIFFRERRNHQYLFLFGKGDGWYKMGGNSLLIYVYHVCPKIKKSPTIHQDTDYAKDVFEDGLITFRNLDTLTADLEKLGLLGAEPQITEEFVAIKLSRVFPEEELVSLREVRHAEDEKLYGLLRPKIIINPAAHALVRNLSATLAHGVKTMNIAYREAIGTHLMRSGFDIYSTYLRINKELMPELDGWTHILDLIDEIQVSLTIVAELKLLEGKYAKNVWVDLLDLRTVAQKEVKKLQKK